MSWADQPGPGRYRLAGALSRERQTLVAIYSTGSGGRVIVEFPGLSGRIWPGHHFGGRETGAVPATRTAAIRVADSLRRKGPDTVRSWELVWRWERWHDPGPGPGCWLREHAPTMPLMEEHRPDGPPASHRGAA